MISKHPLKSFLIALLLVFLGGCLPVSSDSATFCSERDLPYCVDFESLSGSLQGNQLLKTSLDDRWRITGDNDKEFLFEDFPVDGRTREKMILLGDGIYKSQENSLLYTAEINLEGVEAASLSYSLIYRTEKHWDGLVVVAIQDGVFSLGRSENWVILTPENGYPDSVMIGGKLFPGYSGIRSTWLQERIDLAPVLGNRVILGFYFISDDVQEDWGIALDDIAIESSSGLSISPLGPASDLAEPGLDLAEIDYLTPLVPRTNVTADSPCEGSSEMLVNGQRAYTKAINETSDRVLVLHPVTGQYCWVSLENAWIDGDIGELARITDLKPEDYYLPICADNLPPVLSNNNCPELNSMAMYENDLFPYQIESAVVEDGIITQVILIPSEEVLEFDPRISLEDFMMNTAGYSPPGGMLWVVQGEVEVSCSIIEDQIGSVYCSGLTFDASGPIQFDLCWRGFDEFWECPPGFGYYSGGCFQIAEMSNCLPDCPAGYQFNDLWGVCLLERDPDLMEDDPDLCPPGMSVFPANNCCSGSSYDSQALCPEGYFYQAEQGNCQKLLEGSQCPDEYAVHSPGVCYLTDIAAAPRCTSITTEFPVYEISVREATKCYKDPVQRQETVGTLAPFTIVNVLGLSQDGDMLVVQNPEYQVQCWALLNDFYTDEIDLGKLPVITD